MRNPAQENALIIDYNYPVKPQKPKPQKPPLVLMKDHYTPQDVKLAYQVVTQDLFNSLLGAPTNTTIKLGNLGKLIKQERQQKCG
jgi:hypothetical protein